MFAGSSTVAG